MPCVLLHTLANIFNHFILPQLLPILICEDKGAEFIADCKNDPEVTGESSMLVGYCNVASTVSSVCVLGIYGFIADKYGCKTAMMFPMLGITIFNGVILLATIQPFSHHFRILIPLGALFQGLLGGKNTFMMAIFAYTSEVTEAQHRGFAFSMLEACVSAAKTLGPATLGALIINENYVLPLWTAVMFMIVFVGWTLIFVSAEPISQATVKKSQAKSVREVLGTLFATVKDTLRLVGVPSQLGTAFIAYAAFSTLFHHLCSVGEYAIDILYFKSHFAWSAQMIGWFGSLTRAIEVLSMLATPAILAYISGNRFDDMMFVQFGLAARATFLISMGLIPHAKGWYMFLLIPILLFCGPITPRLRSFMSRQAPRSEQAELFVALAVVENAAVTGSMLFSWGYAATVGTYPGAMFEVLAGLSFLSLGCLMAGSMRYPHLVGNRVDYMYSEIGSDSIGEEASLEDTPRYVMEARDSDLRGGLQAELMAKQIKQQRSPDRRITNGSYDPTDAQDYINRGYSDVDLEGSWGVKKGDAIQMTHNQRSNSNSTEIHSGSSLFISTSEEGKHESNHPSYQNGAMSSESLNSSGAGSPTSIGLSLTKIVYPQG